MEYAIGEKIKGAKEIIRCGGCVYASRVACTTSAARTIHNSLPCPNIDKLASGTWSCISDVDSAEKWLANHKGD